MSEGHSMWVHLIWFVACMVFSACAAGVGRFLGQQDGQKDVDEAERVAIKLEADRDIAVGASELALADAKRWREQSGQWEQRWNTLLRTHEAFVVKTGTLMHTTSMRVLGGDDDDGSDPPSVGAADREEMDARRSQAKPTPTLTRDDFSPVQIDDDEVPPVADITHDDEDDG